MNYSEAERKLREFIEFSKKERSKRVKAFHIGPAVWNAFKKRTGFTQLNCV